MRILIVDPVSQHGRLAEDAFGEYSAEVVYIPSSTILEQTLKKTGLEFQAAVVGHHLCESAESEGTDDLFDDEQFATALLACQRLKEAGVPVFVRLPSTRRQEARFCQVNGYQIIGIPSGIALKPGGLMTHWREVAGLVLAGRTSTAAGSG